MNIKLKNLGALKEAEFSLRELTIICGGNNTGKTYATYALFGFLTFWRDAFHINVSDEKVTKLLAEGSVGISLSSYIADAATTLASGCEAYTAKLPTVFASAKERFLDSKFTVTLESSDDRPLGQFERKIKSTKTDLFLITKGEDSGDLVVTLVGEKENFKIPRRVVGRYIGDAIKEIIFGHVFSRPFIASAERTGAAIFRKELNFARNRLLEEVSQSDKTLDPYELLTKVYQDYALPVKKNVDFTRQIESVSKQNSFIKEKHPDILKAFADIIGGEYLVTRNDELYYVPRGKRVKLTMDESSSAVRSLLDIGFYLRHIAQPGDLLMIDEPELNLHPENQRRVARLLARLVNLGIKVFITTHSDYIIKELNTLIMLNQDAPRFKKIANREGYQQEELLSATKVNVYIAEEASIRQQGKTRKSNCQTITKADISSESGIEARSFDSTISEMNRIQEEIVWGGE